MKRPHTTYTIGEPANALKKVQLDNIALVPASLLACKGKYQTITSNLPRGGVLICESPRKPRIAHILSRVAAFLREKGHVVRVLPYSLLVSAHSGWGCTVRGGERSALAAMKFEGIA